MIVVLFVVNKLTEHRKKVKEKNFVSQMSLWVCGTYAGFKDGCIIHNESQVTQPR